MLCPIIVRFETCRRPAQHYNVGASHLLTLNAIGVVRVFVFGHDVAALARLQEAQADLHGEPFVHVFFVAGFSFVFETAVVDDDVPTYLSESLAPHKLPNQEAV